MKRNEILSRLGFSVLPAAVMRVIVDTDAKNEADDQFAIMHHLLSPSLDVRGIVAAHFESKAKTPGETVEMSYREALRIMELAEIDDVPVFRGCPLPLKNMQDAPDSDGVRFIIEEARREDNRPLYIAVQGAMTNVAAALNRAPDIASKLIVIWDGGGPYPAGQFEFNLRQDIDACRVLLESEAEVWQVPINVFAKFEVTLAELTRKVGPCGKLGRYLLDQLMEEYGREYNPNFLIRVGENWTLGDNTTVAVLLENRYRDHFCEMTAPHINDDMTYAANPAGKKIRVYHDLDVRAALEDFYAKMRLAYSDWQTM